MASIRWKRWIGLALLGAGVGYLRARARRDRDDREDPIDLPVGGEMAMDVAISPVDPAPVDPVPVDPAARNPEERP